MDQLLVISILPFHCYYQLLTFLLPTESIWEELIVIFFSISILPILWDCVVAQILLLLMFIKITI